jgi:glycosyltransferase involved in cell wall biosynthesis
MTPRVSVVSTVYNGEPYFDRAIPGILAQTFEDFEFILVDDGSTDRSLDKLHELARRDPRVRVFAPGRLGAAAAYNYGVAQANGEYIARQDFDDRSYPDRLSLQVAFLDAHPEVGMVGGYYILVDERRGERYVRMPPTDHAAIISAMAR